MTTNVLGSQPHSTAVSAVRGYLDLPVRTGGAAPGRRLSPKTDAFASRRTVGVTEVHK